MNIEIFSCSGGMAEGFRRADMVADPPCTPWSRAGKRLGEQDERDMLAVTCRLIALLRPRTYLIGNVPGLQDERAWGSVQRHIGGLAQYGYCVRDYTVLDAAWYGVPQRRRRPFWFGHLEGRCIQWPEPTHGRLDGAQQSLAPLLPEVTVREALADLPIEEWGRPVQVQRSRRASTETLSPTTTGRPSGRSNVFRKPDPNRPPLDPARPGRTLTSSGDGQQYLIEVPDWCDERAATTVMADPRLAPPGHHGTSWLSPGGADRPATTVFTSPQLSAAGRNGRRGEAQSVGAIVLSERAAKRLQGFPDRWVFVGSSARKRWGQLGQAMPPLMAEALARALVARGL